MSDSLQKKIQEICQSSNNDRARMMDIVQSVQKEFGCVSSEAMNLIAKATKSHHVEVESVVSFYSFLSKEQKGKTVIRLCNDTVDRMKGCQEVAKALSSELGVKFGETTSDGKITLEYTPCIGMCDQAPAALINDVVAPNLTAEKVKEIVKNLKKGVDPSKLSLGKGDGNNTDSLIGAAVRNNVLKVGDVIFADNDSGKGLENALALKPEEVIDMIKVAKLRGRGGAGFPTGLKWQFTRSARGEQKFVICNADEGEPGTFKDRVLLTEKFDLLFEGMTIAGYAIGASTGIIYVRGEYAYLLKFLKSKLKERYDQRLLGKNIKGKSGFNFDIRIQMGSGAYICGEESALISSCEGLRGDPKTRPPFPAQRGYLASPTSVNNVETICSVTRILEKGSDWFLSIGSTNSSGTKILSISGYCKRPGVYEYPFGISITDLLNDVGAEDAKAVLVGGPSGQFIGKNEFSRIICYNDLGTGGSIVIFGPKCDLLKAVDEYMEFFVEESCGYCTPCRAGNILLKKKLEEILEGNGESADLDYLQSLGEGIKKTSRCGLGQTSPNPILTTLKNFKPLYEALMKPQEKGMQPTFDIRAALGDAEKAQMRKSVLYKN
ncbi:MAG: NAD(P)H-dependent oxidoreductase subunit E [Candidatus Omnitrophica bacterium]|nr:NAD(P)H-dependent oxidoreductase subunit E [Candidatus Omnitrophota bacterium]